MIYDAINHFNLYSGLNENFADVQSFLLSDLLQLSCGTHSINNTGTFAIISEYETMDRSEKKPEFHKKFIDIQIVLSGKECLGYANLASCTILSFDKEKDFGLAQGDLLYMSLLPNTFAILFPHEAHMPQIHYNAIKTFTKKVVIKVPHNLDSNRL